MAKKLKKNCARNQSNHNEQGVRLVCLDVNQVAMYDRNPRTVRNPEYERIKHSICNQGLEQPLIVTRRPSDDAYMVKAGGNTRLQIMKELYAATGDPRYGMVNCVEVGWNDESSVLLGHLRENSLRGDLTFADQAVAVWTYAGMLAEEAKVPYVTIKELQKELRTHGLPISDGTLSRMRYASEVLMPAMPVALSDGLGQKLIGEISKLHHSARQFWVRRGLGSADEFDASFGELCRRYDGPDWQLEPLRRAVENEIAEAADTCIQTVRMAMLRNKFASLPVPGRGDFDESLESGAVALSETNDVAAHTSISDVPVSEAENSQSLTLSVGLDADNEEAVAGNNVATSDPFMELRQRAYRLATSLASSFKLEDLILPIVDCGNGFLVTDLPDSEMMARLDAPSSAMIGTLWWQLMAFSETSSAPPSVIERQLPVASSLREVLLSRDIELLFERIHVIHAAHFAERFWARLQKKEWQDWLYLVHTHREIRRVVIELERPLWPDDQ